jgi:hypothetical protein
MDKQNWMKNKFKQQEHIELKIETNEGEFVGTLRVRPSTILSKPAKRQQFYKASLSRFSEWISERPGAKKVKF